MSAIAGIYRFNRAPVLIEELYAMGCKLSNYEDSHKIFYCNESVGLIQCLYTSSNSSKLFKNIKNGNHLIVFHGRIDNRIELHDLVNCTKKMSEVSDGELVLDAYRKWRDSCVNNLLGDFSFVIIDQVLKIIFCARDHMGVCPLYYYHCDRFIAFSTEVLPLLEINETKRDLDEERIADFLCHTVTEKRTTFFKYIKRLPPAHILRISLSSGRMSEDLYYMFGSSRKKRYYRGDNEHTFLNIFEEAIRCRIKTDDYVGAYLSGGIDSSAITCITAELLKQEGKNEFMTFSGVFPKIKCCDERKYFESTLEKHKLANIQVDADSLHPGYIYDSFMEKSGEPSFSPHFFMKWALTQKARCLGVQLMLDGHDGDSAVSYGLGLLAELAKQLRIIRLVKICREYKSYSAIAMTKIIFHIYSLMLTESIAKPFFKLSEKRRINTKNRLLNKSFAKRSSVYERTEQIISATYHKGMVEAKIHSLKINHALQPYALEFLHTLGLCHGIKIAFPFFDKRLIEFCLEVPSDEKYRDGLNRSIVRRALAKSLPEIVRCRKDKTDFSDNLLNVFDVQGKRWFNDSLENLSDQIIGYLDTQEFERCKAGFFSSNINVRKTSLYKLIRIVNLDRWIKIHNL